MRTHYDDNNDHIDIMEGVIDHPLVNDLRLTEVTVWEQPMHSTSLSSLLRSLKKIVDVVLVLAALAGIAHFVLLWFQVIKW